MSAISEALAPLPQQFYALESQPKGPTAPKTILLAAANPLRWALLIGSPYTTPNGVHDIGYVGVSPSLGSLLVGLPVSPSSGPILLTFREYGALVQMPWYGFCDSTDGVVTFEVIEVLIQQ